MFDSPRGLEDGLGGEEKSLRVLLLFDLQVRIILPLHLLDEV